MTDRGKRPGLISDSFAAQSGTVNGSRNDFDESVLNCGFYANYCWRAGFSGNALISVQAIDAPGPLTARERST
jgi:hypothetical protein